MKLDAIMATVCNEICHFHISKVFLAISSRRDPSNHGPSKSYNMRCFLLETSLQVISNIIQNRCIYFKYLKIKMLNQRVTHTHTHTYTHTSYLMYFRLFEISVHWVGKSNRICSLLIVK